MPDRIFSLLGGLIGRSTILEGRPVRVVEVLPEGPALVIEQTDGEGLLQADRHGNPKRRVPNTATLRILTRDGDALHPVTEALMTLEERERLKELLGIGGE